MKNKKKIKKIISNIELLLVDLRELLKENLPSENIIDIRDLITKDDYVEPSYYEEDDADAPNVSTSKVNRHGITFR